MLIKKDDQRSEQAMQGHWQYDGTMNGALDETKGEWPPPVYISQFFQYAQLRATEPSRLLSRGVGKRDSVFPLMMSALVTSIEMIDHDALLYEDQICSSCFSWPFADIGALLKQGHSNLSLHSQVSNPGSTLAAVIGQKMLD